MTRATSLENVNLSFLVEVQEEAAALYEEFREEEKVFVEAFPFLENMEMIISNYDCIICPCRTATGPSSPLNSFSKRMMR